MKDFVHQRGHHLSRIEDGFHDAFALIVRLPLHAQGNQKYPRLHRIHLSFEDGAHTRPCFFQSDVFAQFRAGCYALEDGVHNSARVGVFDVSKISHSIPRFACSARIIPHGSVLIFPVHGPGLRQTGHSMLFHV